MRKLLSANFSRLRHNKAFYLALAGVFAICLAGIWSGSDPSFERILDDLYFGPAPYLGAVYAVWISLFLGTEYSDGTMRNKLVVGHPRIRVYLANYLVSFTACLCLAAAWLLGSAFGLLFIGPFQMSMGQFAAYLLAIVGFTASFTAIYTWVATQCTNKAITIILTLCLWIVLLGIASGLIDRLDEKEMLGGMAYIDGAYVMIEEAPNPLHLSGTVRTVCEFLRDLLPTGQTIMIHDADLTNPLPCTALSAVLCVCVTAAGAAAFRRKDIK